ncbi:MAG: sensor domain-containing diguanylate cyclase [Oscillospiraceae bacterium]
MDGAVIIPIIALFVLIGAYWFWIFELIDHLLNGPRLTRPMRLPVCMGNALFVLALSALIGGTLITYLLVMLVLLVEFWIFYRDTFLREVFCAAACIIHVLALRAITTGLFSLVSGLSVYHISNTPALYTISVIVTFLFLNIAIGLVLKLLPLDQVRIVNAHRDQQIFMVAWMLVNIAYLLFSSAIAENSTVHIGLVADQIVAPCVVLFGTYIMLTFAMRTGKLLGYKEKNAELELTVSKEQEYRSSITKDALVTYEFNLNKNAITNGFESSQEELGDMIHRYSDMLSYVAHKYVHPEDLADFARFASPTNIAKEFEQGQRELTVEYRRLLPNGEYIWCRGVTNLAKDGARGELCGFTYVKNINREKSHQMELQHKAERDSLTGLYNKGTTDKLVTEHLLFNHTRTTTALFMIDVDNFKDINDHFGHAYGDSVLCGQGKTLLQIFRQEDIVGRIGGDEYIAYLKSGGTEEQVLEKGAEICSAFRTVHRDARGQDFALSASVGVAISPKDGITFQELYTNADTALYAAKQAGKNNCQLYHGGSFIGYQSNRM